MILFGSQLDASFKLASSYYTENKRKYSTLEIAV